MNLFCIKVLNKYIYLYCAKRLIYFDLCIIISIFLKIDIINILSYFLKWKSIIIYRITYFERTIIIVLNYIVY